MSKTATNIKSVSHLRNLWWRENPQMFLYDLEKVLKPTTSSIQLFNVLYHNCNWCQSDTFFCPVVAAGCCCSADSFPVYIMSRQVKLIIRYQIRWGIVVFSMFGPEIISDRSSHPSLEKQQKGLNPNQSLYIPTCSCWWAAVDWASSLTG